MNLMNVLTIKHKMVTKKIKEEELKIEKKWNLTYFSLGLSIGFISCIIVLILGTIPFIKSIDSSDLVIYDKGALQINKSNIWEEVRKCYSINNDWAILSYHSNTSYKGEEGFYCNIKDCNDLGYCKDIELKLEVR